MKIIYLAYIIQKYIIFEFSLKRFVNSNLYWQFSNDFFEIHNDGNHENIGNK